MTDRLPPLSKLMVLVVLSISLLVVGVTPSALAGDNPTVIYVDTEERTVTAGETTEIDVLVSSQATHGGVGLESISLVATYDEAFVSVTDVDTAGWFEEDGAGEVQTDSSIDNSAGIVTVDQRLDPPGDGAAGTAVFVTLTVEVAEDAPETETAISFDESDVQSATDFPQPVFAHNATLAIEPADDAGTVSASVVGAVGVGAVALVLVGFAMYRRRM